MLVWLAAIFGALMQGVGAATVQLAQRLVIRTTLVLAAVVALAAAVTVAFLAIRALANQAVGFVSSALGDGSYAGDVFIWMKCLMPGSTMTAIGLLVTAWLTAAGLKVGWEFIKLKAGGF
jgi:hypothetical protein